MIPLARPALGDREVDAVAAVLRSGMLVQGPLVERFEALLAERCARRFGVAVSSGTAALQLTTFGVIMLAVYVHTVLSKNYAPPPPPPAETPDARV